MALGDLRIPLNSGTSLLVTDAVKLYDPRGGRKVPSATAPLTFTQLATAHLPRAVGVDGYVYANHATTNLLIRSNDGFATTEAGPTFANLSGTGLLTFATKVAEGYVAVFTDYGNDLAEVWFSTSFTTGWTKKLDLKGVQPISIGRPTVYGGGTYWFIGEYGTGATRNLYMSRDGGQTWTVIKTVTRVTNATSQHFHHAAIDTATGRIWAIAGDNLNDWSGYSDDMGATWTNWLAAGVGPDPANPTVVYNHPSSIAFIGDRMIVTNDESSDMGTGFWEINRTTGRASLAFEVDPVPAWTQYGHAPWVQDTNQLFVCFPPNGSANDQTNTTYIAGTGDQGLSWHVLYRESYDGSINTVVDGIVGPDPAGRIYFPKTVSGVRQTWMSTGVTWNDAQTKEQAKPYEPRARRGLLANRPAPNLFRGTCWPIDDGPAFSDGMNWVEYAPNSRRLTAGEALLDRPASSATITLVTGQLMLGYFTALKTETITSVKSFVRGTAAAGLTVGRIGIYSVAANGTLTLVASTPNDTAAWPATFAAWSKTLSASWKKVAGTRYAVGFLAVGSTMPVFYGMGGLSVVETLVAPAAFTVVNSLSDLPSPTQTAPTNGGGGVPQIHLIP